MQNYNIGDVILFQSWAFGQQKVLVKRKAPNIKFGRAGFAGPLCDDEGNEVERDKYGNSVWGYDHQVIRVVKSAN